MDKEKAIEELRAQLIEQYCDQYPDEYVRDACREMWQELGHGEPYVIITQSPRECARVNALLVMIHEKNPELPTHEKAAMAEARWKSGDMPSEEELKKVMRSEAHAHAFWHWIAATSGWHKGADIMGIDHDKKKAALLEKFSNAVETGFPREEVVVVSRKPIHVAWSEERLDREDGPVVEYPDGFKAWSINGVVVDEQICLRPETQTLDQIDKETNMEVKRIRIERYGWERYLEEKNAKVVDFVKNEIEQCNECLMSCDDMMVLVCACPSTARVYCLEVDPKCNTVEKAQNYLSGGRRRRIIGAT